ncbi:MAG: OmpA family protein [Bacteroidota bacterium]
MYTNHIKSIRGYLTKSGIKICFLSAFFIILSYNAWAQEPSDEDKELAKQYLEQADLILEATKAVEDARDLYITAADTDPTNLVANFKAGDYILQTNGKERAAKFFIRILEQNRDYRFDIEYLIGRSYQYGQQFEEALNYYEQYKQKYEERKGYRGTDLVLIEEVNRRIFECQNALKFQANPANFKIKNVGREINSSFEDYAPVLNEDETELIFTTRRQEGNLNENVDRDNKYFEDIFISRKVDGQWQKAENIGTTINTEFHNSNLALSADGRILFLYNDDNNGDIYFSNLLDDGTWTVPEPISDNINSSYAEKSVSLSPDGNILFFSSNRPAGSGKLDIYYSVKTERGEWGRVRNLGPVINTEYDDDGPFLDYDGKTLYFSSRGRDGMGGFDIFKSVYDSAEQVWSDPINLGVPINTPDDDIYFVSTKDGERGYYASFREDGEGYTDIYEVTLLDDETGSQLLAGKGPEENTSDSLISENNIKEVEVGERPIDPSDIKIDEEPLQPIMLTVTVTDENTGSPIDVKIGVKRVSDNRVIGQRRQSTGVYQFEFTSEEKARYRLSVEKQGYIFENRNIDIIGATTEPKSLRSSIALSPVPVQAKNNEKTDDGTTTVPNRGYESTPVRTLRNVYFDFDKVTLKPESNEELNKLERFISQNPGIVVEIGGHTDKIGSKSYNKRLSERRAQAVVSFLTDKGIDPRRVKAVGYGAERPLASNDDEAEGRELNRRVEFRVIGNTNSGSN